MSHKSLVGFARRQVHAKISQAGMKPAVGDGLTVDQHPISVEDGGVNLVVKFRLLAAISLFSYI